MKRFFSLLRLEIVLFVRQPFSWVVLLTLVAAMQWGGHNAGLYRDRQTQVLASIARQERDADKKARLQAERYSHPMTLSLPWWKDPTDAYGYITHYLKRHAVKPASPLGGLAVGQSDLLPYYIAMDIMVTAPEETTYDFESPRKLSLGSFDLAFVLVYLLPLALITLSAFRLSSEQDSGTLRLIAAQPVRLGTASGAKFGAVALVSTAVVIAGAFLALLIGGLPPLNAAWIGVLAVTAMSIAAYVCIWVALAALVVSFWKGATTSTAMLVGLWATFTALVPALGSFVLQAAYPAPSRLAFTDKTRQIVDAVGARSDQVISDYAARVPRYAKAGPDFLKSKEIAKIAVQQEVEDRLRPYSARFDSYRTGALAIGSGLRLLSPSLMLDQALQTAAGTDAGRQGTFVRESRDFRDTLRRVLWTKALDATAYPRPKSCTGCPASMAFSDFDAVPTFHADLDAAPILKRTAGVMAYLWMIAISLAALALLRFRVWPRHL